MSRPPQKRLAHIKRKCKTLRETEFFLENSVSAARFLNMSGILKDLLLITMRRISPYKTKNPVVFRESGRNMSRLPQKRLHIECLGVYTVSRIR